MQLSFLIMFIALLVWTLAVYLKTNFDRLKSGGGMMHGGMMHGGMHGGGMADQPSMDVRRLRTASFRLAFVGTLSCAFLFFPVTRGSSILPLFGLSSEASVKYHVWLGHITLVFFAAHSLGYIIYWAIIGDMCEMVEWAKDGVSNVAGELAMVFGLVLWATTFRPIRRKSYELFFYTHQLYALFMFFFLLHVGISFFFLVLPGVYLFLLDRYLRFLQSQQRIRVVSARLLPNETVELNFSKTQGLKYTPLSYVFICVPSLSKLQWHPFTISSSSNLEPETLSVIIKKEGSWTQKLHQTLSSPSLQRLEVAVEGPYGDFSTEFLKHDCLVLVSGGSGITPYFAMIQELIFMSATKGVSVPKVRLICAFKTVADLSMLDLLLPLSTDKLDASRLDLTIDAYVTREKEAGKVGIKTVQTLPLKPLRSDRPITGILGPNSWLWLGAVIASSFVLFLLLLGIVGRYYIYTTEKESDAEFSTSIEAILALIFMCVSITGLGGAAFLWARKNASALAAKIENFDVVSPMGSPKSAFGNAELESHPQEVLKRATTVHYGERPDLQKILLQFEKWDCGVLASGPRGLRGDVARICSSGLADNLHFHSISFTW
ncbi:ferric reduction oxidase 2-like [Wolffia australiana]